MDAANHPAIISWTWDHHDLGEVNVEFVVRGEAEVGRYLGELVIVLYVIWILVYCCTSEVGRQNGSSMKWAGRLGFGLDLGL